MRSVSFTLGVVLCAGLVLLSAQGTNPRIGTWQNNVAKSKYDPGPAPKSQTLETVTADGSKATSEYTANYDGKPYPIKGSLTADMVALTRVDSHTTERVDSKGGKTVQTFTRVVSKDGKTMTVTIKGTNAQGKPVNNVIVFEKK